MSVVESFLRRFLKPLSESMTRSKTVKSSSLNNIFRFKSFHIFLSNFQNNSNNNKNSVFKHYIVVTETVYISYRSDISFYRMVICVKPENLIKF